jgi:hypothetical protein
MHVLKSSTIFHRISFSSLQSRWTMLRGIERLRKQISHLSVSYFSILLVKSCKCEIYRNLFSHELYCQTKNSDIYNVHILVRWLAIQTEVSMVSLNIWRRTPLQCFKTDDIWFLPHNFQLSFQNHNSFSHFILWTDLSECHHINRETKKYTLSYHLLLYALPFQVLSILLTIPY